MSILFVLCLGVFCSTTGWRVVEPMLFPIAGELGVSVNEAVLLATAYSIPFGLMSLVFGPMADSLGKVRVILWSLVFIALSQVLMALSTSLPMMLAARVLGGIFAGGVNPVVVALMSELIPYAQRQVALARFTFAHISGQMAGAAVAGMLVDHIGWRAMLFGVGVFVAGVLAISVRALRGHRDTRKTLSIASLVADYRSIFERSLSWVVLGVLVFEGILVLGIIAFVPAMLVAHEAVGSAPAGIVIACFALGGLAFAFSVKQFLAWLGPWNMLRVGGTITGLALLGTALPLHWTAVAGLFFLAGFGFYLLHSPIQLCTTELAPRARGAGLSMASLAYTGGQGLGPLIGAAVAGATGYGTLFALSGLLTVVFGFVAAALIAARAGPRPTGTTKPV